MDDYNVHSLNDIYNIQKIEEPLSYNPDGGLVQLEDGISHYINYLIQPSEGGGDGGGGVIVVVQILELVLVMHLKI